MIESTTPIKREFCTAAEAAEMLGVHPSQITRYVKAGLLDCERVGNVMFLKRAEVRSFERPKMGNPSFRKTTESA